MRLRIARLAVPVVFLAVIAVGCGRSVTKEDYDKIKTGMSKDEVVGLLGSPATESESEMMGTKTELLHYQTNTRSGAKAITIIVQNGSVVDKQWTQL